MSLDRLSLKGPHLARAAAQFPPARPPDKVTREGEEGEDTLPAHTRRVMDREELAQ